MQRIFSLDGKSMNWTAQLIAALLMRSAKLAPKGSLRLRPPSFLVFPPIHPSSGSDQCILVSTVFFPRLARLVRRGRRGGENINVPPAWLTPVEEGRAGCGCCRHEVHSNNGVCGGSLVLGTSQVVVGDVMTWVPPTRLQACSFGPTVPRGWAVATEKER
jgi:hypothetical protein